MSSKSICNIQIIAITELKLTVELHVNIAKLLYDENFLVEQVKYASKISSKTNCLFATPVSSQQNEKHPNEVQQRLPKTPGSGLGRFVRRYSDCKYPHIAI